MAKLSNIRIDRIVRRTSSGDNDAPMNPPLTADEISLGGRLDNFCLVLASGDDGHSYQWTFPPGTTKAQAQASVKQWFVGGKAAIVAPMLTATDTPPAEQWDTAA
jgi:hypothetical protein